MGVAVLIFLCLTGSMQGESLHSYVNDRGIKVFTNIGIRGSQTTGTSPSGEAPAAAGSPEQTDPEYLSLIRDSSSRYQVDANLVKAIMEVESNYNPSAISSKGCIGLMQLHPETARRFNVKDIFDPAENIEGGVKYLSFLMDYFKSNLSHVLAAYNAGEKAVTRHRGIPPYPETRQYVRKVMALYESVGPASSQATRTERRRLYRLQLPDGSVLYTDSRSIHLASAGDR